MKEYYTIAQDTCQELEIKKSRFICTLKRIETEEEARELISTLKKEHHKANHNCSAFILGENAAIKRSSDDGEPAGTAGMPILNVLEKKELTKVVAVVTRYFGGIKLGAGGLIRAYGSAVAHALKSVGIVEVKEQQGIALTLTYAQYQHFLNWRTEKQLEEYDTAFLTDVNTTIYVDKEEVAPILEDLHQYFHGQIEAQKSQVRVVEVPVI